MGTELAGRPDEELVGYFSHQELDLSRKESVFSALEAASSDILVNCAAFTNVDQCETNEAEARVVNADGPAWLAEWCGEKGIRLIHISTDYVFSGKADRPYRESDPVAPQTAYGRTKREGEERVMTGSPDSLVVRTSWVFGPGQNFVEAILRQAELRKRGEASGPLRVVSDQRGSPTYAADLAEGLIELAQGPASKSPDSRTGAGQGLPAGLLHLSNSGETSWFGFAREILDRAGHAEIEVVPVSSDEFKRPAPRPAWSVLDCERAASEGVRLREWPEALGAYLSSRSVGESEGARQ